MVYHGFIGTERERKYLVNCNPAYFAAKATCEVVSENHYLNLPSEWKLRPEICTNGMRILRLWEEHSGQLLFETLIDPSLKTILPESFKSIDCHSNRLEARIRHVDGQNYFFSLKIRGRDAETRYKLEIPIPESAVDILRPYLAEKITKHCYHIEENGIHWEISRFGEPVKGLVIAERELAPHETGEEAKPLWLGQEITQMPAYYSRNLAAHGIPGDFMRLTANHRSIACMDASCGGSSAPPAR